MSFVSTVVEISPQEVDDSPRLAEAISYWNEGSCTPAEWLRQAQELWGNVGLQVRRGDEALGFAIFGPSKLLPRTERLSGSPPDPNTVFLAWISGDRRIKKHLLVRVLKDLRQQGVMEVEAITSDLGASWHVSTNFLLENGWHPVRSIGHPGYRYTLMRTDLGNAVEVGELARDIIGRVKIPKLKNAPPLPGEACVQAELPSRVESSPESGKTTVFTAEMPSGVVA